MNSEHANSEHGDDPILDACLSELLGGHAPPDLTARLVGPNGQLIAKAKTNDLLLSAIVEPPPIVTRQPAIESAVVLAGRKKAQSGAQRWSIAAVVAVAAAFIGVVVTIGMLAPRKPTRHDIAKTPAPTKQSTTPRAADIARQSKAVEPSTATPATTIPPLQPAAPPQESAKIAAAAPTAVTESTTAPAPPTLQPTLSDPPPAVVQMPPLQRQSSADNAIVSFINDQFEQTWKKAGVRPSAEVSDAEWCQRLFARVLGRAATAGELKVFTDDKAADRREKLVKRLLADKTTDKKYAGEFAQHWSAVLAQAFLGRGTGASASRDELQKYFASALASNKSYAQIANDLLTATGSSRSGENDYNPAVNFLVDGMTSDATAPTARVARVMLGHQLQCAQCHQHPSQGWSQDQFWGLNACFRQVHVERTDGAARLVKAGGPVPTNVSYRTLDGQSKTATPRFIDGSDLSAASGTDLLASLADRVVKSDDFCRAAANRIWAQLFDYGFTRPLDDLGPSSPHPESEVLDRLAGEFATHDFDLKAIIRWAVLSEPFNRSSKLIDLVSKDMPEEGEPALFSRFYSRPSRSADAFASLAQVVRIRSTGSSEHEMERARVDWLAQANRSSAKASPKKAPVIDSPSIVIKAADPTQRPATGDPSGLVKTVAARQMSFDRKAEHLFLAALGRQPTQRERRAANELLRTAGGSQPIALDDLWWSLQNSSECIFDR